QEENIKKQKLKNKKIVKNKNKKSKYQEDEDENENEEQNQEEAHEEDQEEQEEAPAEVKPISKAFRINVSNWVKLDNRKRELSTELKEINQAKKEIEKQVLEYMGKTKINT